MKTIFTILPDFLRNPDDFFRRIRDDDQVESKAIALSIASFLFLMAYGFTLGISKSPLQAVSSAIKIPILFLSSMAFCLPALYFFSLALLGTPLRMIQVLTVVLSGIAVTGFLLLGLAPITLFFVLTSNNYPFFQLLAVLFVGISALIGVYFLWRGMTLVESTRADGIKQVGRQILGLWMILYGFVGTQMTWRLSPFIGKPDDPFYLIKPTRDNFYVDVLHAVQQTLNIPALDINLDTPLVMAGLCLVGLVLMFIVVITFLLLGLLRKERNHSSPAGSSPDPELKTT